MYKTILIFFQTKHWWLTLVILATWESDMEKQTPGQ
jgi:hypothetical protein